MPAANGFLSSTLGATQQFIKGEYIYIVYIISNEHRVRVMVLNATFNNISVISWRLVFFMVETGVPRENHRLVSPDYKRNYSRNASFALN